MPGIVAPFMDGGLIISHGNCALDCGDYRHSRSCSALLGRLALKGVARALAGGLWRSPQA